MYRDNHEAVHRRRNRAGAEHRVRCVIRVSDRNRSKADRTLLSLRVNQNDTRIPNCSVRGSPTAVTVLNDDTGFDGYDPVPNVVLRVIGLTRLVKLNASTRPSIRIPPGSGNDRFNRRLKVKKSPPVPAFRGMNWTWRTSKFAVDTEPSANGLPGVPCRLLTPDTMLNGSDE